MDNQLEPITLNSFNKILENDITLYRDLENYLDVKYSVIDTCLTLANLCLDLETINPECAAYTKQRLETYYAACEARLNKTFTFHTPLPLSFDDLPKLKSELVNIRTATTNFLALSRDAAAAIKRYPELLFTLHTMREKGIPTDDIDASIKNTDAELEEVLASKTFPNENFKKLIINMNFYRIQVEKLEHWIHQKASETTLVIAQPPPAPAPITTHQNPNILSEIFAKFNELKAEQKETKKAVDLMSIDLANKIKSDENNQHAMRESVQVITNHTAFIAAEIPNHDQIEAAQNYSKSQAKNILTYKEAALIMKQICGPYAVDIRTLIRWVKEGKEPTTGKPITDAAFSSVLAWSIWCQGYNDEMQKRANHHNTIQKLAKKHSSPPPENEK